MFVPSPAVSLVGRRVGVYVCSLSSCRYYIARVCVCVFIGWYILDRQGKLIRKGKLVWLWEAFVSSPTMQPPWHQCRLA